MARERKLTTTSYAVLGLVDLWGPCTPYDLKQAIEMTLANFWPVPHTTFYAEPEKLEQAGLLSVEQEEGGRRRKLYSITDAGRTALRAWVAEPDAAPPQLHDELMLKVFLGADPEPLAEARIAWHRAKAEELEGYLQATREEGGMEGVERALIAGLAYSRTMAEMIGRLRRA
jgi:PadR family transcriptional regulator AphA